MLGPRQAAQTHRRDVDPPEGQTRRHTSHCVSIFTRLCCTCCNHRRPPLVWGVPGARCRPGPDHPYTSPRTSSSASQASLRGLHGRHGDDPGHVQSIRAGARSPLHTRAEERTHDLRNMCLKNHPPSNDLKAKQPLETRRDIQGDGAHLSPYNVSGKMRQAQNVVQVLDRS